MPRTTEVRETSADPMGIAADPAQMRAILARALLPAAGPALHVADCRVVSSRHREDGRGTVIVSRRHRDESLGSLLYELSLKNLETGESSDHLVTGLTLGGMRTRRLWQSAHASSQRNLTAGSPLQHFAYVPELDLLLQVFPHDIRLPAIARLLPGPDAEVAERIVSDLGPGEWQVKSWRAEAIQYRPDQRAILRLAVQAADAASGRRIECQYYAKVYREGHHARQAFQSQVEVHQCIERAGAEVAVAKPVALIEDVNTTITGALPGIPLADLIREGVELETAVPSVARAVAAFHGLEASAPRRPIEEDLTQLREAQAAIASRRPDLSGLVADIVTTVTAGLSSSQTTLLHGDLKPEHILIDGDNVGLIDCDFIALGDPMVDVAFFVALLGKTEERSRKFGAAAGLARRLFLNEYFSHVPESWRPRLGLHHAMMSVHKAAGLTRKSTAEGPDPVASVLREGAALLSSDGAYGRTPSFKRRPIRASAE